MGFYSIYNNGMETFIYLDGKLIEQKTNPKTLLVFEATNKNGMPTDIKETVYLCEHNACKYPDCNCKPSDGK